MHFHALKRNFFIWIYSKGIRIKGYFAFNKAIGEEKNPSRFGDMANFPVSISIVI